jgi:hypothetical protein
MTAMRRSLLCLILCLTGLAGSAAAQTDAQAPAEVQVKREDPDEGKLPTLRFLRENRDFLRAQLDLLRQTVKQRDGQAQVLGERDLMFKDMLKDILAAQDTVSVERARMDQWTLLESVRQLGDLEGQLDLMESLLGDQQQRLTQLEADFVGLQQTALVILLRGTQESAPTAVLLQEDGEAPLRVALTDDDRQALAAGGIAQLFHELVEPRALSLTVSFEGTGWADQPPRQVDLEPERDRLTFLELDLDGWSDAAGWTSTWAR